MGATTTLCPPTSYGLDTEGVITVRLARQGEDDDRITELRAEKLGRAFGHQQFVPEPLDVERDRAGFVFCAEQNGELVASIRALPYETGLSGVADQVPSHCETAYLDASCLEVSRFVARRASDGLAAGLLLLREAARWTLENTKYRRLYALAPVSLVTYYTRLGMTVAPDDVWREGCAISRRFVSGDLSVVARR
ncbi:hypothetical protein ABZS94_34890 [Streptomyces sp. NPDC005500]|uniref:hypothetical protein n=1 Tax=Streptomyces sp. NPDC005500 TaxID=3155007 RepID=UPI0033ADEF56